MQRATNGANEQAHDAQSERAVLEVSGVLDSYDEYLARLRTVTPAEIQRVAQAYFESREKLGFPMLKRVETTRKIARA